MRGPGDLHVSADVGGHVLSIDPLVGKVLSQSRECTERDSFLKEGASTLLHDDASAFQRFADTSVEGVVEEG